MEWSRVEWSGVEMKEHGNRMNGMGRRMSVE